MDDPYELIERAWDMAHDCKCPCDWGSVVSPAVSYGAKEDQFALSCIDCDRSTRFHTMRSESDVVRIVKAWRKACANA